LNELHDTIITAPGVTRTLVPESVHAVPHGSFFARELTHDGVERVSSLRRALVRKAQPHPVHLPPPPLALALRHIRRQGARRPRVRGLQVAVWGFMFGRRGDNTCRV